VRDTESAYWDLAFAWQDLVAGHEIQMTNNADQSRTFAFVAMHKDRLYILEGTVPKGYPAPGLFQQSMGYVDKDGNGVRYQSIYTNMYAEHPDMFPGQPKLTGQGGGGRGAGAGAGAPASVDAWRLGDPSDSRSMGDKPEGNVRQQEPPAFYWGAVGVATPSVSAMRCGEAK